MKKQRGVTLIELVIAVVVGGLILTSVSRLLLTALSNSTAPEYLLTASTLGKQKLEETANTPYASLLSVGNTPFTGSFSSYSFSVDVSYVTEGNLNTPSPTDTGYKKATVTIRRNGQSPTPFVTLVSSR